MTEPSRPGSPEYEENWGDGLPIPREEFEAIYAQADAALPWTWGGTPTWVSTVGLVVAVAAVVLILLLWGGRLPV
jgi:uncharacterized membrane protein YdbT with pleckstrin-like domain